jgi:glycosyltransferase involved in cell wall biosynthesis
VRIAQIAALPGTVAPASYRARETVVRNLSEGLLSRGHEVTQFGPAELVMPGNHVSTHLSDDHTYKRGDGWLTRQLAQLQSVAQRAGHFDVIHFHTDLLHLLFAARLPCPHVTTVYGPLCAEEHGPLLSEHPETPLVSTSAIQRRPVPWMNWRATIFYGLAVQPVSSIVMASTGDYLLFMDDIAPRTSLDVAIRIAARTGLPLKVSGVASPEDQQYYKRIVAHCLGCGADVAFLGDLPASRRWELLGHARALLVPGICADVGGINIIEAASCGTPVVALRTAAHLELIVDGVNGRLVTDEDGAVQAAAEPNVDRDACKYLCEQRFTCERMVDAYEQVYEAL